MSELPNANFGLLTTAMRAFRTNADNAADGSPFTTSELLGIYGQTVACLDNLIDDPNNLAPYLSRLQNSTEFADLLKLAKNSQKHGERINNIRPSQEREMIRAPETATITAGQAAQLYCRYVTEVAPARIKTIINAPTGPEKTATMKKAIGENVERCLNSPLMPGVTPATTGGFQVRTKQEPWAR